MIVLWNQEQGRETRILLVLLEKPVAERDSTVHECLRVLALEDKVRWKQTQQREIGSVFPLPSEWPL